MNADLLLTIVGFYALVLLIPFALVMLYFRPQAWHLALALCTGVLLAFISVHSAEPQLPAVLLLLFGVFLGFARPSQAWLWGILLAAWIPAASFIAIFVQGRTHALLSGGVGSFLSFAFSFAGSYLGALAARLSPAPDIDIAGLFA